MDVAIIVLSTLVVLAGAGILFYYYTTRHHKEDKGLILIQQQLDAIREHLRLSIDNNSQTMGSKLNEMTSQLQTQFHRQSGTLNDTRKAMDERLDNAARIIGDLNKTIGRVQEALVPVGEIRDILKSPKQRGGFGEIILERLLEEALPSSMYDFQYSFANGERVDAVIKIGGQAVSVDSKFPLEKYHEYIKAPSEDEKKTAMKGLLSAVKKHANDVAKYIRPDEGTYPFAFMYIPSESIYYELFASGNNSLWQYAASARVFPVSSNTLYIYLQTIALGLKGMQIAEHAQELLGKLEQLQKSFGDIRKNFERIGTHLKNAQGAYDDTDKRLEKLENKFETLNTETPQMLAEPAAHEEDVSTVQ